jgi:hypothetical protein
LSSSENARITKNWTASSPFTIITVAMGCRPSTRRGP